MMASPVLHAARDASLREARRRLLDEMAPGTQVLPFTWSGGSSEALMLGEGPPVLLVHGGFSSSLEWVPLLPLLAARHRVIAPDRPGCGLASPFDYRGVDVEAHGARFLEETMDALGIGRCAFVGNSMGGRWAIALAGHRPERVSRLVLPGVPAGGEGRVLPLPLRALRTPGLRQVVKRQLQRASTAETRAFAGRMLVAHPERMPDVFWAVVAQAQGRNVEGWLSFASNVVGWDGRVVRGLRLDGRLGALNVPTLFLWGERDAFADAEQGRRLAAQVPGGELVVVPGAGHLPWLDEPERVAEIVLAAIEGPA